MVSETVASYLMRDRAGLYNAAHLTYPPLAGTDDWVTGTWCIGACYRNGNRLYGAYPRGYLERVHSMFPDARKILHAFSGGLTIHDAMCVLVAPHGQCDNPTCGAWHDAEIELVDMHGPDQGRYPTWQGDLHEFCALPENAGRFDLILADPPYSAEDAKKYDCPPPRRADTLRALRVACKRGGNLVWLDQVWPMHRKAEWRTWAHIGLVRSTNHRVRLVSMFEAV